MATYSELKLFISDIATPFKIIQYWAYKSRTRRIFIYIISILIFLAALEGAFRYVLLQQENQIKQIMAESPKEIRALRIQYAIHAINTCIDTNRNNDLNSDLYCNLATQSYIELAINKVQGNEYIGKKAYFAILMELEHLLRFLNTPNKEHLKQHPILGFVLFDYGIYPVITFCVLFILSIFLFITPKTERIHLPVKQVAMKDRIRNNKM